MDNQLEECHLFLCVSFVPYRIPHGGGGGGNFVQPLVRDCLLEVNLLIDPHPPFFGGVSEEGGNFWPPPTSRVKKRLIEFPKQHIELSFATIFSEPIKP